MIISEKELEDMIFNADKKELDERGLWMPKHLRRQVRIGNYGIADIVGFERGFVDFGCVYQPCVYIYELKKEEINIYTFLQAVRYAKGIISYFKHKRYTSPKIYIALIGGSIDMASEFLYLPDLLDGDSISLELYTFSLNFNGIYFKKYSRYGLKDEGFNIKGKNIPNKHTDFSDF
jgi:hypothetical protein